MTVKEIVKLCSDLLQYDFDERLFDESADENVYRQAADADKRFKLLSQCVGYCEKELACDYFPLTASQFFEKNSADFTEFERPVHEVRKVKDGDGDSVDFVNTPDGVVANTHGCMTVEYSYLPEKKGYADRLEIGNSKVDERLVAYGAIAEYMFLTGMYDEASMWDKRYKDLIQTTLYPNRSIRIPQRRWE